MANRIEGVTENLLNYAMKEFLAKGYNGASMRTISESAGTTPRSIYTRYGDKEGLFSALVKNAAEEMKSMFCFYMESYHEKPVDDQKKLFHDDEFEAEYQNNINFIVDYIYSHWNEFKLLICFSEGTKYAGFVDEIVEIEEKYTLLYIEHIGNDVISSGRAKPQLIHLLCSSFMHGFFEMVRYDMNKDDALVYIKQLQTFFSFGWDNLFNP